MKAFRLLSLVAFALLAIPVAQAAQPFDAAAFQAAQSAGKPILLEVTAPWCPTCAKQKPIVQSIETARPDLVAFAIDFDSSKELLKAFRVSYQSTLIIFKGKTELARSTGDTDPIAIRALVEKAY